MCFRSDWGCYRMCHWGRRANCIRTRNSRRTDACSNQSGQVFLGYFQIHQDGVMETTAHTCIPASVTCERHERAFVRTLIPKLRLFLCLGFRENCLFLTFLSASEKFQRERARGGKCKKKIAEKLKCVNRDVEREPWE